MTSRLLSQPTNTTQIPATDNRSLYYLINNNRSTFQCLTVASTHLLTSGTHNGDLGFWISCHGFRILCQLELDF